MRLKLAYGRSGLEIELPPDAPVTVIEPQGVPGLPDEPAAITSTLRTPLGTRPLRDMVRPEDTVAVVFSDLTRPMPNDRVLPPLLNELALAGVPDAQIVLVNGLGTHRPQTEVELAGMLGSPLVERYRVVQHNAWDDENLVEVRILTGFIEPHLFAGFSGGPKAVLPGIADIEAIMDNHGAAMLDDPRATWAVLDGNPVWEEMLAVAQSTSPTFLLNVTLNRDRRITGVFAGDLVEAHRTGAAFVRQTATKPVREPFDIVITSNSGYPLDLNLYQAVKGMSAAARIVRPGGDIIVAAECWDGIPAHGEYRRLLWEAKSPRDLMERVMTPGFRCHDQWEVQVQAQIQLKANVHVYADGLSDEEVRRALFTPCRSIEETVARLRSEKPGATIAVLPDGPQTVPHIGV
jgi:nickel-dependent lactate racemase